MKTKLRLFMTVAVVAVLAVFAGLTAFAEEPQKQTMVWDFEDGTAQGWNLGGECTGSFYVEDGIAKIEFPAAGTNYIARSVTIDTSVYRYVALRMRHNVPIGYMGPLPFIVYYRGDGQNFAWGRKATENHFTLSDEYKTMIIDMSSSSGWTGTMAALRIDPFQTAAGGYVVEIDKIVLAEGADLTLNPNDGGTGIVYNVPAGVEIDLSKYDAPERTGYKFEGWTDGNTNEVLTSIVLEKDTELFAKWSVAPIVWDFNHGSKQGWSVQNGVDKGLVNGAYKVALSTSNEDTWIQNTALNFNADNYKYLVAFLRHNVPETAVGSTPLQALFVRTTGMWSADLCVNMKQYAASEEFVPHVIDMSENPYWNGTVTKLRIDPFHIVSPAGTEYYFEADKIMVTNGVKLTLGAADYTVPAGVPVKLSDFDKPEKSGFVFAGWSETQNGKLVDEITITEDTVLYENWISDATSVTLTDKSVKAVSADKEVTLVVSSNITTGRPLDIVIRKVSGFAEMTFEKLGISVKDADKVKAFLLSDMTKLSPLCEADEITPDKIEYAKAPAAYDEKYGTLVYFNNFKDEPFGNANLAVLDAGQAGTINGKYVVNATRYASPSQKSGESIPGIEIVSGEGLGNRFKYKDGTPIEGKMTVVYEAFNKDSARRALYNLADEQAFGFDMWLGYYMNWSGKGIDPYSWATWSTKALDVTDGLTRVASRANRATDNIIYFHSVAVYVQEPGFVMLTDENGNGGSRTATGKDKFVFPSLLGDRVVAAWTDGIAEYKAGDNVQTSVVEGKSFKVKEYADLSSLAGLNVVCIGDSLTEGAYGVPSGSDPVVGKLNYPYYFGQFTGANVINNGKCGWTPKLHFENKPFESSLTADTDVVIIMLGTNNGLSDTLESDTAYSNYNDYANTETGNYAKIIEYVTEKTAGNAKIILMTPPVTTRRDYIDATSAVVKKLAAKYGLDVIDVNASCGVTDYNIRKYMPVDELHFHAEGYKLLAAYVSMKTAEYYTAE